jgi:hypothetical protein
MQKDIVVLALRLERCLEPVQMADLQVGGPQAGVAALRDGTQEPGDRGLVGLDRPSRPDAAVDLGAGP